MSFVQSDDFSIVVLGSETDDAVQLLVLDYGREGGNGKSKKGDTQSNNSIQQCARPFKMIIQSFSS